VSCAGWTGGDVTLVLHMLHRIGAVVVLVAVSAASLKAFRAGARLPAIVGPLLVVAQMTLGLLTITTFRDIVPLTAHLAVAAALLANMVTLHLAPVRSAAASDDELVAATA